MNITIAAICRDELANVVPFLENAKYANQVIVLDTGSTDGTYELLIEEEKARQNLKVFKMEFNSVDFSVFRNSLLALANTFDYDIIVHLDMDERLEHGWVEKIQTTSNLVRGIVTREEQGGFRTPLMRVFSKHAGSWKNTVHEGFYSEYPESTIEPVDTGVSITHLSKNRDRKEQMYVELAKKSNHADVTYYELLHIYSELKDYDLFISEYEKRKDEILNLDFKFRHLLCRYAIVCWASMRGSIPDELVEFYLTIDDAHTRFMLSRYWSYCKNDSEMAKNFRLYEIRTAQGVRSDITYMPYVYSEAEIARLRDKVNECI